ncbi:MAG: DnaJ family domain-containing protein [Sporolactobacillus sp.]
MGLIEHLAEEKIQQGLRDGQFEQLPGAGEPQKFEDDSMVPADLRVGYKLLHNAGYLPEELQLRKELVTLNDLLRCCTDGAEKEQISATIKRKRLQFEQIMANSTMRKSTAFRNYRQRIMTKLHL